MFNPSLNDERKVTMFHNPSRSTRVSRIVALGAAAAVAITLTACSSSAIPSSSTSSSASDSSLAKIDAKVADLQKAASSYAVPKDKMPSLSGVKGKTVFYVPLTQQAPQFAVTQAALQVAFDKVGVKLQVCDGQANPTGVSACLDQATKAQAGAVITDSIPNALAANAFAAVEAAGIPVLNTDQIEDSAHPAAEKLGYIYAPGSELMVAAADWIISDSKGKGSVVINQSTDGPAPVAYVAAAQKEFSAECPDCTVTINPVSTSNFALIAPSTSSALLKTPNVGYIVTEFEQFLQPTQGGVQQAGKTATVKGVSGAAQLSGLQMLAKKNFLFASVGQASAYQGWISADAVLRMMTGTSGADLPEYTIPIRLFTSDNIGDIKLTDEAQASGEWFGPSNYTDSFLKLWGVN
jgi:ribose transport system substrate-binding protein